MLYESKKHTGNMLNNSPMSPVQCSYTVMCICSYPASIAVLHSCCVEFTLSVHTISTPLQMLSNILTAAEFIEFQRARIECSWQYILVPGPGHVTEP